MHHRVTAPLKVTLEDGQSLIAANWSLGGLRLDQLASPLPGVNDELSLLLELPFQGFDISFEVEAKVVRVVEQTGTIGVKFTQLSERANDLMSHFIDDLVRGKMATVEDTICRIDIPVTPISTKPDANPVSQMPVRRWPLKTIIMSTFYIVLGVSVFLYLAILIFNHTARMEVASAVVSAPLVHLSMPVDGKIFPVSMENGVSVKKGQKLARITGSEIEADITDMKLQLELEKRNLTRAHERLRIESERMKLYSLVKRTNMDVARAKVQAKREALLSANKRVERLALLHSKRLVTQYELESAKDERRTAEARLKQSEFELEQTVATQSLSDRRHFDAQRFVADLDLLALEVESANSQLLITSKKLEKLEKQQANLHVTAPFDGRIVSVNVTSGGNVRQGRNIATLEKNVEPEITAFLDQDEIIHVGVNDEASVYLPALGKSYPATVRMIDRNSSSLRLNASHYVWSGEKEKSASVGLLLQVPESERPEVTGGLPAVVLFSRRSNSRFFNSIENVLAIAGY